MGAGEAWNRGARWNDSKYKNKERLRSWTMSRTPASGSCLIWSRRNSRLLSSSVTTLTTFSSCAAAFFLFLFVFFRCVSIVWVPTVVSESNIGYVLFPQIYPGALIVCVCIVWRCPSFWSLCGVVARGRAAARPAVPGSSFPSLFAVVLRPCGATLQSPRFLAAWNLVFPSLKRVAVLEFMRQPFNRGKESWVQYAVRCQTVFKEASKLFFC